MSGLIVSDPTWSLGVKIGLPIAGVLLLLALVACVGAACLYVIDKRRGGYEPGFYLVLSAIAGGCAALVVGVAAWAFYPYDSDYHRWQPKHGQITEISSRLLSSGDNGTTQKFVVALDSGGEFACNDTRCSLLHKGDYLSLSCKKAWQFSGTDGWDCNYVDSERAEAGGQP